MAKIISTKRTEEKDSIIVEALMEKEEYLQLKGHMDNIHIFSNNTEKIQTNIAQRGKNYATKYFLIPRQFRRGFKFTKNVGCQKIDLKEDIIFIYSVDKLS